MTPEATFALISVVGAAMTLIGLLVRQMIRLVETLIAEQQQTRQVIEQDKKDAEATRQVIERNSVAWTEAARALADTRHETRQGIERISGEVGHVRDDLNAVSAGLSALREALNQFATTHSRREAREAELMQQIAGLMTQLKVLEQHVIKFINERGKDSNGY